MNRYVQEGDVITAGTILAVDNKNRRSSNDFKLKELDRVKVLIPVTIRSKKHYLSSLKIEKGETKGVKTWVYRTKGDNISLYSDVLMYIDEETIVDGYDIF